MDFKIGDSAINTSCIEKLKLYSWIVKGSVIIQKGDFPHVAEITGFTEEGNPIIEYDSDGSIHDYMSCDEIVNLFEPYKDGMKVYDSTGRGRFKNPYMWKNKDK